MSVQVSHEQLVALVGAKEVELAVYRGLLDARDAEITRLKAELAAIRTSDDASQDSNSRPNRAQRRAQKG